MRWFVLAILLSGCAAAPDSVDDIDRTSPLYTGPDPDADVDSEGNPRAIQEAKSIEAVEYDPIVNFTHAIDVELTEARAAIRFTSGNACTRLQTYKIHEATATATWTADHELSETLTLTVNRGTFVSGTSPLELRVEDIRDVFGLSMSVPEGGAAYKQIVSIEVEGRYQGGDGQWGGSGC